MSSENKRSFLSVLLEFRTELNKYRIAERAFLCMFEQSKYMEPPFRDGWLDNYSERRKQFEELRNKIDALVDELRWVKLDMEDD